MTIAVSVCNMCTLSKLRLNGNSIKIIQSRFSSSSIARATNSDSIARVEAVTTISRKSQRLQALTSINGTDASQMQSNNKNNSNNNNNQSGANGTGTPSSAVNHRGYNRIPVLNKKCADNETDSRACHLFETCASSLLLLLEEVEYKLIRNSSDSRAHCGPPQSLDVIINVRVAFYGGFILGTIIGVIILYVVKQLCVCVFTSQCGTKEQKRSKCQRFSINSFDSYILVGFLIVLAIKGVASFKHQRSGPGMLRPRSLPTIMHTMKLFHAFLTVIPAMVLWCRLIIAAHVHHRAHFSLYLPSVHYIGDTIKVPRIWCDALAKVACF